MALDEFQENCNYYYYSVFNNPSLKPALPGHENEHLLIMLK
jgi:hypothetical protein